MDAGRLRKLVSIRQQSTTRDTLNQSLSVWNQIPNGQVWACVEPQTAAESFKDGANQDMISHIVTLRYRSDLTADMAIYFLTRRLAFVGIIDVDERHEWLQINCVEARFE